MSIFDKDLITGRNKVDTAIDRILDFCSGKKTLVAFSGGKDSQCCYHLCQQSGINFTAQYSITRFEPPELLTFIREHYPDVTFRRAYKRSLVETIGDNGLPNRWFRWCCDAKHKHTPGFDIAVIGIRAAESPRRAANWRLFGQKRDRSYYLCPIIDWTDSDVWEYLAYSRASHCSLYDEGFTRIGCVCCPLSPKNMRRDAARWPKIVNALYLGHQKNWEKAVSSGGISVRGKPYRMLEHGSARDSFEYWLDNGMMIKDVSLQDEPCLFAGSGFSSSDALDLSSAVAY